MDLATIRPGWYLPEQQRMRLAAAVLLSLLIHAFILSLQFGIPGFGLPGLSLPWEQRRAQLLELRILPGNPEQAPASPAVPEPVPIAAAAEPAAPPAQRKPHVHPRPKRPHAAPARIAAAPSAPPAPSPAALPETASAAPADASPAATAGEAGGEVATPPVGHAESPQPVPQARIITQTAPWEDTFSVPPATTDEQALQPMAKAGVPDPLPDSAAIKAGDAEVAQEADRARDAEMKALALDAAKQAEEAAALALQRQAEQEASRLEELKRQEQQQEQERAEQQALALETQEQADDAARQALALAQQEQALAAKRIADEENARREREAMQLEELRRQQEAQAERDALALEARRQADENARRQAAEELAARERERALAASRKAQAEAEAARQRERELLVSDRPAANTPLATGGDRQAQTATLPGNLSGGGLAARALEQARTLGSLREPAPATLPSVGDAENPRRRSIFGRVDNDVGLKMYVESWRLKIERNGRLNYRQSLVDTAYTEPIVTVAVRSDGSVEEIVINRSSGRPELDEAVRRIIRLNARYGAFPAELARRYDVVEIRHVWNFDDRLRLLEEVR